IEKQLVKPEQIFVTNYQNKQRLEQLSTKYHINGTYDPSDLYHQTDLIILAMKPKDAQTALGTISQHIANDTLLLSVLAGISIAFMEKHCAPDQPIARAMPNTSAMVGQSATAISVNNYVT